MFERLLAAFGRFSLLFERILNSSGRIILMIERLMDYTVKVSFDEEYYLEGIFFFKKLMPTEVDFPTICNRTRQSYWARHYILSYKNT